MGRGARGFFSMHRDDDEMCEDKSCHDVHPPPLLAVFSGRVGPLDVFNGVHFVARLSVGFGESHRPGSNAA